MRKKILIENLEIFEVFENFEVFEIFEIFEAMPRLRLSHANAKQC